jgi:hypothetical protein
MHKDLANSVDQLAGEMAVGTTGKALQSKSDQSLANNSITEHQSDPEYEYQNDETRGIQIFYVDNNGSSASVSLKNLSKDEMDGALKASGENDYVKDVISALTYLKEADNKHRKILTKLAAGKKVTPIRKASIDYDHYRVKDVISKDYPENNELKGVYWDPKSGLSSKMPGKVYSQTPAMGLNFEMGKAFMHHKHPILYWFLSLFKVKRFGDLQEWYNLKFLEKPVAKELGEDVRPDIKTIYPKQTNGPLTKPQ